MARILIIEDEKGIRFAIRRSLERAGYDVMEASDGEEGLRLFQDQAADLVITDLVMPEKEGLEVIMEIHRKFPATKVIAISGGIKTHDFLPAARLLGASRTFLKPFDLNALVEAVGDLLHPS
jgi:DNA-binding response OmpR family regulator